LWSSSLFGDIFRRVDSFHYRNVTQFFTPDFTTYGTKIRKCSSFFGPISGAILWIIRLFILSDRSTEHRKALLKKFPMGTIRWVDRYARYDLVPTTKKKNLRVIKLIASQSATLIQLLAIIRGTGKTKTNLSPL
jgi:hypothetical protein